MTDHRSTDVRRQGSALMLVMIISAAVVLIVSATIKGTVTEIKINDRYMTRLKAKSAAESAIEYGASELAYRFTNKTSFPTDELSSNRNPLSMPYLRKTSSSAAISTIRK